MNQDISFPVNLIIGGKHLLKDTNCTIKNGSKYGIIGMNGIGKTTFLNYINDRQHPELTKIHDIYMVNQEIQSSDKTIYEVVLESNFELIKKLSKKQEIETLLENNENISDIELDSLNDQLLTLENELVELEYEKQESKIKKILSGLGFIDFNTKINIYSGGWRMRIALACALYKEPSLLLLDEPTNHLDLEANVWLINYLKNYKKTIMVISHDIQFLNEVCSNIINIEDQKLNYYNGGYNKFKKQYDQMIKDKTKQIDKIEKNIKEMRKNGKTKIEIEEYLKKNPLPILPFNKKINIEFGKVNNNSENNLITLDNIYFSYNTTEILSNITLGINYKSRIAFVGKNGSGKSTLMKVISGDLEPQFGEIKKDHHIRISYFNQHTFEYLPLNKTPIEYLIEKFPHIQESIIRSYLGKIGLDGTKHKLNMENLSGGQKVRVSLVELQLNNPHIIVLDEPTNHLDLNTIEALKESINTFDGAVIITTHSIDFIEDTECTVYEISNKECNQINFDDYCNKILVEN